MRLQQNPTIALAATAAAVIESAFKGVYLAAERKLR